MLNYFKKNKKRNLEKLLKEKEEFFGGVVRNVSRNKVSPLDPRTKQELKKGGMVGGDRMTCHRYAEKYAEFLLQHIDSRKNKIIVEVGILQGTGIAIWCDVFPRGRIIGLDIDLDHINNNMENLKALCAFSKKDPELYKFDQFVDNVQYMKEILKGDKIDICMDDGFHSVKSILKTMESIVPYLSDNFVYFIEDNDIVYKEIRLKYPNFSVINDGELTVVYN